MTKKLKILHNCNLITMNASRDVFSDGAVLIDGDTIRAVDCSRVLLNQYREDTSVEKIDMGGGLLIPGLINAHTHTPMSLFRGVAEDMPITEWWGDFIFPLEKNFLNNENVSLGTEISLIEMLLSGTTTIADFYFFSECICQIVKKVGMRAVVGQSVISFPAPDFKSWEDQRDQARDFLMRWKKDSLITPALTPHAPYSVKKDHLIEIRDLSREMGCLTMIHVAEGKGEMNQIRAVNGFNDHTKFSTPVEYLNSLGFLDSTVTLVHMVHPSVSDLEIVRNLDVKVVHCPQSNLKLGSGISPVAQMIQHGICVGLGTDGAASNNDLSLWGEIDFAGKLQKGVLLDPTVMTSEQVFAMATINGAKSIGMDHLVGSIEVGKKADFVLIDLDQISLVPIFNVYSHLVNAVNKGDVKWVMVGGEVKVRDKKLVDYSKNDLEVLFHKVRNIQGQICEMLGLDPIR